MRRCGGRIVSSPRVPGVRVDPQGGRFWIAVALLLALPSAAVWSSRALALVALSWQPRLAGSEPWRWWSAAWVHLSEQHLLGNLAGAALVAALGWAAEVPRRAAWAWLLAWPLTHLGLLLQPQLQRYGGMSGVLHAGVAVVAVHLLARPQRRARALGGAIAAGLVVKIVLEAPWQGPLLRSPHWDIAVAPLAHLLGVAWGALCALACLYGPCGPQVHVKASPRGPGFF
jgi:rhomboid family GlyGly-CTERM serine protease